MARVFGSQLVLKRSGSGPARWRESPPARRPYRRRGRIGRRRGAEPNAGVPVSAVVSLDEVLMNRWASPMLPKRSGNTESDLSVWNHDLEYGVSLLTWGRECNSVTSRCQEWLRSPSSFPRRGPRAPPSGPSRQRCSGSRYRSSPSSRTSCSAAAQRVTSR